MTKNVMELFNESLAATKSPRPNKKSTARAVTSTRIHASAAKRARFTRIAATVLPKENPIPVAPPPPPPLYDRAMRARWLQQHDVRTELLDLGVGCCWFAQQGEDEEPVCGQSEEEAIGRLAREKRIPWATA